MTAFSSCIAVFGALTLAACASGGSGGAAGPEAGPAAQPTPDPNAPGVVEGASAGDGVYTDAQADRGRDAFRSGCTECHNSREFHDAQFRFKWSRRDLGALYELVATTMPEDEPGSLAPQTYADVIAYVLRLNELAAGSTELTPDPELLAGISLAPIR